MTVYTRSMSDGVATRSSKRPLCTHTLTSGMSHEKTTRSRRVTKVKVEEGEEEDEVEMNCPPARMYVVRASPFADQVSVCLPLRVDSSM